MASSSTQQSPLLVDIAFDSSSKKVFCFTCDKKFIDVLCSFLTLPLGSIAQLIIDNEGELGGMKFAAISNIRDSLDSLPDGHFLGGSNMKTEILNQLNAVEKHCSSLVMDLNPNRVDELFICSARKDHCAVVSHLTVVEDKDSVCSKCHEGVLNHPIPLRKFLNGFLAESRAKYIVKDDLHVFPFSFDADFDNLDFGLVKPDSEKHVFTEKRLIDLLKCCLFSKTPLSDYFFKNTSWGQGTEAAYESSYKYVANPLIRNPEIQVKLCVGKEDGVICFARASEAFVELLLGFLTYPLGSVVRLLDGNSGLESIDNLYKSVSDLNEGYLPLNLKNLLVDPLVAFNMGSKMSLVQCMDEAPHFFCYSKRQITGKEEFLGNNEDDLYLTDEMELNPNKRPLKKMELFRKLKRNDRNFLADHGSYMIHVGLLFRGIETPRSMANKSNDSFTEKIITIDQHERLEILRASLNCSRTALHAGISSILSKRDQKKRPEVISDDGKKISLIRNEIDRLTKQVAQLNCTIMDGGANRIEESEIGDLTSSLSTQLQQLESIIMDAKLTIKRAEIEIMRVKKCMSSVSTLQTKNSSEG